MKKYDYWTNKKTQATAAFFQVVHRSQNNSTNAQNVLRVLFKKRRRSGLRRGFLSDLIDIAG